MEIEEGRSSQSFIRANAWLLASAAGCFLFALLMMVNVDLAGNVMWFWYAQLFHQGVHLYRDLHFVMQPLFILELNAWMRAAGPSVIAVELLSVLHTLLFIAGLFLLIRETRLPDLQRAVLLGMVFFSMTFYTFFLFNDYHLHSFILAVFSLWLLSVLYRRQDDAAAWWIAVALGVMGGLATMNRINDGLATLAGSAFCVPFLVRRRRWWLEAVVWGSGVLVILLTVASTGDSLRAWSESSIFRAMNSKGGSGSLLSVVPMLFINALRALSHSGKKLGILCILLFAAGPVLQRLGRYGMRVVFAVQCAMVAVFAAFSSPLARLQMFTGTAALPLELMSVVLTYAAVAVVFVRWVRSLRRPERAWDARETLVVPVILFAGAAASSGAASAEGQYATMGLLFAVLAVVFAFQPKHRAWLASATGIFVLLSASMAYAKVLCPYAWHAYSSRKMFTDRIWYRHPVYGPMYMERETKAYFMPLCDRIHREGGELLSLPFPQGNFYCGLQPWHGYVQTFFDISTAETVHALMDELKTDPPKWILYQRQLLNLRGHELTYNHGQPLAHRALDTLLVNKVASGEWTVVDRQPYQAEPSAVPEDGWYLIRTEPSH